MTVAEARPPRRPCASGEANGGTSASTGRGQSTDKSGGWPPAGAEAEGESGDAKRRYPAELGEDLRSLRVKANLTQSALGQAVGLPQSRISMIERGDALPEWEDVPNFAAAYGLTTTELTSRIISHLESARKGAAESPAPSPPAVALTAIE